MTNINKQTAPKETTEKYDKMQAQMRLMGALNDGRRSGAEEDWIFSEDVRTHFRTRVNTK